MRKIGVSHVQSSIDLESLKSNEGKYDLVINNLFLDNEEIYKSYQHLTAIGGVYVMLGLPSHTTEFKIDLDYMIRNEITAAGSPSAGGPGAEGAQRARRVGAAAGPPGGDSIDSFLEHHYPSKAP